MYIEVWQLVVIIVACGLWSEYRYIRGRTRAYNDATRDVDTMVETSISKAKVKYLTILAEQIMTGLLNTGLLERKGNGVYVGKDDKVFDVYAAIEEMDKAAAK